MPPESTDEFAITVTITPVIQRADLVLSGDIDLPARPLLADAVSQIARTPLRLIVVDLAAVTYAGSTLVHFLTRLHNAAPADTRISVSRPTPIARLVLQVMAMDQLAMIRQDLYV
jgi:anti-anti-sigma regulatory factor